MRGEVQSTFLIPPGPGASPPSRVFTPDGKRLAVQELGATIKISGALATAKKLAHVFKGTKARSPRSRFHRTARPWLRHVADRTVRLLGPGHRQGAGDSGRCPSRPGRSDRILPGRQDPGLREFQTARSGSGTLVATSRQPSDLRAEFDLSRSRRTATSDRGWKQHNQVLGRGYRAGAGHSTGAGGWISGRCFRPTGRHSLRQVQRRP